MAMDNVFKATQKHGGSFRASDMIMRINGKKLAGHIVQQVNLQYQQQITTLFEIGSNNVYYVGGRAQGNMNLSKVAGPAATPGILISAFNDICKPGKMVLTSSSSQCSAGGSFAQNAPSKWQLSGVIVTTFGLSTQAQDVVVNEQLGFQFLDLETEEAAAAAVAGGNQIGPPALV